MFWNIEFLRHGQRFAGKDDFRSGSNTHVRDKSIGPQLHDIMSQSCELREGPIRPLGSAAHAQNSSIGPKTG
jgi:hypothetical protein